MSDVLSKPLKHFRAAPSRGAGAVVRDEGAGLIQSVSVITRGEALGHDLWIDSDFLTDVTAGINASENGVKARFTHPGLSSDGLGTYLGRIKNAVTIGDQVFGDLHLAESAHKAPDGDLADYVMQLAEDDPEAFGVSIVFEDNATATREHMAEHMDEGRFASPDELNQHNLPHARLSRLRGGDVVDEPAANPDGLFQRKQELAADGEHILDYALGLSDTRPELRALNADPDRIASFVQRYLGRHNLEIRKAGDPVTDSKPDAAVVETPPTREELAKEFRQELKRFTEAFGAEHGTDWFEEGISFGDAQSRYIEKLNQQISARDAKIDELSETLSSLNRGETEPADFSDGTAAKPKRAGLNKKIRIANKQYADEN